MRLGLFGTGYAGLVTSVCLAQLGHTVTAIDKNPDIVARLSDGVPTIHEPGLEELLTSNLEADRLSFTTTAELIKQAANAFLATKISFINLVSDLCEKLDVDVTTVAKGIGLDPRIGRDFLNAGLGFGGSCLPKDVSALIRVAGSSGVDVGMLKEVERINVARIDRLLGKVERALWVLPQKVIGVLGVSFKPDTDDIRGAPSLGVIPRLHSTGAILRVYDPAAVRNFERLHPPDDRLSYVASAYDAARDAHALVILTDWDEFQSLDFSRIRTAMHTPIMVDGRNLFAPSLMQAAGFEYYSLGRGDATLHQEPSRERV